MTKEIRQAAEDITLRATLLRIKRKADIMALDAPRGTLIEQNAVEFQLLAGIALRCIGVDSEARQDSTEERRRKHMAVMDDKRKIEELIADLDTSTNAIAAHIAKNREAAKLALAFTDQGEAMGYEFAAMAKADADLLEALQARAMEQGRRERALIEGAEINRQALLKHNADHAAQVATLTARVVELEGALREVRSVDCDHCKDFFNHIALAALSKEEPKP
jgi:hypothetical protein